MYNVGGNIVSKNEYAYTEGMIEGEPTKTYNYSYSDAWKDQLTNFDGQSIVYDTCGNPTSYLGATLAWSKGRLLTRFTKDSTTSRMTYDANGIRMSKLRVNHIDIVDSSYIYDSNGRLRTETEGAYTRRYLYSSDGIVGYEENGERYFYRKNLFGDITAIYQGATKLAEYVYDAWGNCTIAFDTNGVGARNPMRYRGYYWDEDLKMYYLMTRYYDPRTGRFINPDIPKYLDPETLGGLNLYAYCNNNPVMNIDPSGCAWAEINDSKPLITQIPELFLLGLESLWNLWVSTCESITIDVGVGGGLGFDLGVTSELGLGLLCRADIITIEKQSGAINDETLRLGSKYEAYAGASTPFGFLGKGLGGFNYYFSDKPDDEYTMDKEVNLNIGFTTKIYFGLGATISIGFDVDYFFSSLLSGQ